MRLGVLPCRAGGGVGALLASSSSRRGAAAAVAPARPGRPRVSLPPPAAPPHTCVACGASITTSAPWGTVHAQPQQPRQTVSVAAAAGNSEAGDTAAQAAAALDTGGWGVEPVSIISSDPGSASGVSPAAAPPAAAAARERQGDAAAPAQGRTGSRRKQRNRREESPPSNDTGSGGDESGGNSGRPPYQGQLLASADRPPGQLAGAILSRVTRYAYARAHCFDEPSATTLALAAAAASSTLARRGGRRLLIFQPMLPAAVEVSRHPFHMRFRLATVEGGELPTCDFLAVREETDGAMLADAVAAKIDREGFTQVRCSSLSEAPKALLAMAEARDWLRLYRVKDFSVAVEAQAGTGMEGSSGVVEGSGGIVEVSSRVLEGSSGSVLEDSSSGGDGSGGGGGGSGQGGSAWPLTFTLLEVKWNCMTYFKY